MLVDWTVRQKKQVLVLLGLILVLTSSFLTYEWTQYAFGIVEVTDPERLYSRLTKTLTSLLVFLLAIRVGDAGINQADPLKLKRAFFAIFLGDLLFLMDEFNPFFDYLAVLAFLAGQVLLILRNGQGLQAYWRGSRHKLWDILLGAGILVATGALFFVTLYPSVKGTAFLYIIPVYALLLDLALWTAWMTLKVGYFPRANAWLIVIGATCFFIGDYLVGFNLSLSPSMARVTTMYLTWLFYAPAITLLALSGYRWRTEE